jgi:hypothetical protein
MMKDGIDIRVSPSIDPEVIKAVEGYNEETAPFVGDVINTFNDIYMTLGKVHDARELAARNPAFTPENRVLLVAKEADKHKERLFKRLDRAHDDLKARIVHTEAELSRPLTQQAALGSLNAEVRAYCKELSRADRSKLISEAMAADDDATLQSILGAQPFLSGLSRVDHDYYIHQYHSKKNPHLVARLTVMKGVLDKIHQSGPIIHRQFEKAIGGKPHDVNAIQTANERALAALRIEPTA